MRDGIALITIQKDANKSRGLGGQFSEHLASLYFAFDYNRITCVKAKEWTENNPNGNQWGFEIVNHGSTFSNIRPIEKCKRCFGTGSVKGGTCDECFGTGYKDCGYKEY